MLTLSYGLYAHAPGETTVTISSTPVFEAGQRVREKQIWSISGFLRAQTEAAMKTAIQSLILAYSVDGQDLIIKHSDASQSAHAIISADTIGGTRVVEGVSFPDGQGAEYAPAGKRSFQISIEAEWFVSSAPELLSFVETLSFEGGAPMFAYTAPIEGSPQIYQTSESSIAICHQSGSAIGRTTWPTPPEPVIEGSGYVVAKRNRPTRKSPERIGNTLTNYEISWNYEIWSTSQFDENLSPTTDPSLPVMEV